MLDVYCTVVKQLNEMKNYILKNLALILCTIFSGAMVVTISGAVYSLIWKDLQAPQQLSALDYLAIGFIWFVVTGITIVCLSLIVQHYRDESQ